MTIDMDFASTSDGEGKLGQADLAHNPNVSLGAVKALEHGNGSTLKTFARVVRGLGKHDWLAELEPALEVSPFDLLQHR